MAEGWVQHHDHLVEFDQPEAENAKPSIFVRVAEPADDDEKKWKVSIIGTSRVSCTASLLNFITEFGFVHASHNTPL